VAVALRGMVALPQWLLYGNGIAATPTLDSSCRPMRMFWETTTETPRSRRPHSSSANGGTQPTEAIVKMISTPNVAKYVALRHENGPRRVLRGPFCLVAGTGFEPATSGL
jgi:hypothetical protein